MPYDSIPGIGATYVDGAFATTVTSTQPRILILGTASQGLTYEVFQVTSTSAAEKEFGALSEMMKPMWEAITQGADNVAVMRVGGTQGSAVLTDSAGGTLTITPEYRDDGILDRYRLVLEANSDGDLRILVWDDTDKQWVFDSDDSLALDLGVVQVENSSFDVLAIGDKDQADSDSYTWATGDYVTDGFMTGAPSLEDFRAAGVASTDFDTTDATGTFASSTGTAGTDGASMTLVERYAALEQAYQMLDYRDGDIVIPTGVFFDDSNLLTDQVGESWATLTARTGTEDDTALSGSVGAIMAVPTAGDADDFLGYVWQYLYKGKIYTFFADGTNVSSAQIISHHALTGDEVPSAVYTAFAAAGAAEFREVNFGHQLATFCYTASTVWSTMLGVVTFKEPPGYSRTDVQDWAGTLPDYSTIGLQLGIAAAANNGTGILGNKLMAGEAAYRNAMLDEGSAANGLAYGGLIKTAGGSLPTKFVYGISEGDEDLDSNEMPIDIGKHMLVCYDYVVHTNRYNGGSTYQGALPGALAGKLTQVSEKEEPIGINGTLRGVSTPTRLMYPTLNDLARIRVIGMRREEGLGYILVTSKTAAHPDSDYSRLSTIRSVNREISGIRGIAKSYIGKEFSSSQLISLQTAIDAFLKAEKEAGFNQGAVVALSYTRADKIMGRLTIKLKMIPPFSVESITVETSLAADESEL